MRFFELLNNQHFFMYFFGALGFLLVFGLALAYSHFRSEGDEDRKKDIIYTFPGGFEDRNAPFPVAMTIIIIGTAAWVFFYILCIGIFKVVI